MRDVPDVPDPVARSPIAPPPPAAVVDGWEVCTLRSDGELTLTDVTPLAKMVVRARPPFLGVGHRQAARDPHGTLVIGSGPDEWTLLGPVGSAGALMARVPDDDEQSVTIVDVTHGRALMRLTGADAPALLAKVCAINLADAVTPNGAAFRSSVAKLVTDVVRDDRPDGAPSYLLHCERSSGQYLFDSLLDAGAEFGIEVDGFPRAKGAEL